MTLDGVELEADLTALVRWLVHRNKQEFDYTSAVNKSSDDKAGILVAAKRSMISIQTDKLLNRECRDVAYLSPLRELVGDGGEDFYETFSRDGGVLERLSALNIGDRQWNFLDSFVAVDGGDFDNREYAYHGNPEQGVLPITSFSLSDFPVTNQAFELFCPSHRRTRDSYANQHDSPAVYMNWWMATEFCEWLSALTGQKFRLPSE